MPRKKQKKEKVVKEGKIAPNGQLVSNGHRVHLWNLVRQGRLLEGQKYAAEWGLEMPKSVPKEVIERRPPGADESVIREDLPEGTQRSLEGTAAMLWGGKWQCVPDGSGGFRVRVMPRDEVVVKAEEKVPEGIQAFAPAREPLPAAARYAKVVRNATNPLLKGIRFEDNGMEDRLWVSYRQNARGLVVVGKVVAVTWNEDEVQGGWKLWRK
jgi:hypothetical protein